MTKTIVLAIVVSLIVWALTFNSFFESNRGALSISVAVGIGILAGILIYALTKGNLTAAYATMSILAIAFLSGVLLYALSGILTGRVCRPPTPTVQIDCQTEITVSDNEPCLNQGKMITWTVKQKDYKFTIDEFQWTIWTPFGRIPMGKDQPLNKASFPGSDQHPARGVARNDKDGVFKYRITCIPPDGDPWDKDPMIDIPKP